MAYLIYLLLVLIVVFPVLEAGMIRHEFNTATKVTVLVISVMFWMAIIWNLSPPINVWVGLIGAMVVFEIVLHVSGKLTSRWVRLGYLKK